MNKIEFEYKGRKVKVWCVKTNQDKYLGKYSITFKEVSFLDTANGLWDSCEEAIEIAKAVAIKKIDDDEY